MQAGNGRHTTAGHHPRRPPTPLPPAATILTSGKAPEIRYRGLLKFLELG
jgi:hypothetical protein